MPSPESSQELAPTEIAGRRNRGKERFAVIPTHMPGVLLRAEPDVELDILKKTIERLASLAQEYAARKFQIEELASQQKEPDREIKTLARTHEGLRGVQSEEDNFILNVFPKDSVTWDPQLLKESLGIAYSSIVHADLLVSISVPVGFQTERGPLQDELLGQVLTQALVDLGLPEADLKRIMEIRVGQRVDEKTLDDMIKSGKVSLLEGTRQTERTWAITVVPLKKSPES